MNQQVEQTPTDSAKREWYAINNEQQRVMGPFRSEQECALAVAARDRRQWDLVPLVGRH